MAPVMAALYLRGAPRPFELKRGAWIQVERCLRLRAPDLGEASEALRLDGLWAEGMALHAAGLLTWAEELVEAGCVLTVADESYPRRWLERLGPSAPPAVWMRGKMPVGSFLAIVGGRDVGRVECRFARGCGAKAGELGYGVVSGGARGCDAAAMLGAAASERGVAIVPYGMGLPPRSDSKRDGAVCRGCEGAVCTLSACALDETFSTGSAMERNALIYAMADAAVVAHARFKTGGTWHGAVDAHRRKLTRLIVRADARNQAHRALVALGAIGIRGASELEDGLGRALRGDIDGSIAQPKLCGLGGDAAILSSLGAPQVSGLSPQTGRS
jgi:predicted Rossmann fold nucleotide-binding protein DprA/Smf involved in DNA uptake